MVNYGEWLGSRVSSDLPPPTYPIKIPAPPRDFPYKNHKKPQKLNIPDNPFCSVFTSPFKDKQ